MINFNELNNADYATARFEILFLTEGSEALPYLDTHVPKHPTIGIGFDLTVDSSLKAVLDVLVGTDFPDGMRDELKTVIKAGYTDDDVLRTAINNKMAEFHNVDATIPDTLAFASDTDPQIKTVLNTLVEEYENRVNRWLAGIPNSSERVALLSLAYNGGLGANLKAYIDSGDRAEAWYEIRYQTNGGPIDSRPAVANRRYVESESFGLFSDHSPTQLSTQPEAHQAAVMYGLHRDTILAYEENYSPLKAATTTEVPGIQNIYDEMMPAIAYLKAEYGITAPIEEVQMLSPLGGLKTSLNGDGTAYDSSSNDQDLLIGNFDANTLKGGVGNDALVGLDGNDTITGGAGSDTVEGGAGGDVLWGGAGSIKASASYPYGAADIGVNDSAKDTINGGAGNDILYAGVNDLADGGADNDVMYVAGGVGLGGSGGDTLRGLIGAEQLAGGAGMDKIYGSDSGGLLIGHNATVEYREIAPGLLAPKLVVGADDFVKDEIYGGKGNDIIYAGDGDYVDAKGGNNEIHATHSTIITKGGSDKIIYEGTSSADGLHASTGAGNDALNGSLGDDVLWGAISLEHTLSNASNGSDYGIEDKIGDTINAGAGDDIIFAGAGDLVNAGDGDDEVWGGEGANKISGGADDDEIWGEWFETDDASVTGGVNERVAGNDTIYGDAGDDILYGMDGDDSLSGGIGSDELHGGDGDDFLIDQVFPWQISASPEQVDENILDGGDGNDHIEVTNYGTNTVYGGDGDDDVITFANAKTCSVVVYGGAGKDKVGGSLGDDVLFGNDDEQEEAGHKEDVLQGGGGNDTLVGGVGDTLIGGAGDDVFYGEQPPADAKWSGGWGVDTFYIPVGAKIEDYVYEYKAEEDVIVRSSATFTYNDSTTKSGTLSNETMTGTSGGERFFAAAGNDSIRALDGADVIDGGAGKDTLWGGTGADVFVFSSLTDSVHTGGNTDAIMDFDVTMDTISLVGLGFERLTTNTSTAAGELRLAYSATSDRTYVRNDQSDFEFYLKGDYRATLNDSHFDFNAGTVVLHEVTGSAVADTLNGAAGSDVLSGLAGNDKLFGGAGNDTLNGGAGVDQLTGGAGMDIFAFTSLTDSTEPTSSTDGILDFVVGEDYIDLRGLGFAALDTDGGITEANELRLSYSATSNRTYVRSDQSTFEFYVVGDYTTTLTDDDFLF
jgi:Ca2+-binding RTX toxin-like protein